MPAPAETSLIYEASASAVHETDPFYKNLATDREAIRWLVRHADELTEGDEDGTFSNIKMLKQSMVLLNEDLVLDEDRDHHVARVIFSQYCRMNHIDESGFSDDFIRDAIVVVEKYILGEEADPRYSWNASMLRQSREKPPRIFETLVGRGGVWRTLLYPDRHTKTAGAQELQQMLAAGSLIFAQNAAERATEHIPFHPNPPDTTGRQAVADDGKNHLAKAEKGELWGNQKHLRHITLSHAKHASPIDVLTRTIRGKTHYREFESFATMPVRVWRENAQTGTLQYVDVPINKLLELPPNILEGLLSAHGEHLFGGLYAWKTAPKTPNMNEDGPIMSISAGHGTTVDSELFEHTRSGQSVVHMHYNLDKNRAELYWSHASVDGVPGKAMTLALARAVGATKTPPPRELEIEWFPPVQDNDVPGYWRLWALRRKIQNNLSSDPQKLDYLEDRALNELVYALHLSDVTVHTELTPQQVARLDRAASAMNTAWYTKAEAKIQGILANDPLSKRAEKALLNRLAAAKMNSTKFIDLMTRQFFGPMAVCMLPRDPRARLQLALMPNMADAVVNATHTYAFRKADNPRAKVFGSPAEEVHISRSELLASLEDAFRLMTTEYGLDWLLDFTILTVLQESTQKFRFVAEATAANARKMFMEADDQALFDDSLIRIQNSHLGDSQVIEELDGNEQQVAVMGGFTSAETWHREIVFAGGIATYLIKRKDGTSISVDMRNKATPELIDNLRIYDRKAMLPAIEKTVKQLGQGDANRTAEYRRMAQDALEACAVARRDLYKPTSKYGISSTLIITEVLMRNRELFEGLKVLCIAGELDMEERFLDMTLAAADEIADALEAKPA